MKKALLIILAGVMLLMSGCALLTEYSPDVESYDAQSVASDGQADNYWPAVQMVQPFVISRDVGSSGKLIGNSVLVTIFIHDTESGFNDYEREERLGWLSEATQWLEAQAKNAGHIANFIYGAEHLVIDHEMNRPFSTERAISGVTMEAYEQLEALDGPYLYEYLKERHDAKNVGFIFFINKDARSYSHIATRYSTGIFYFESCVIFAAQNGNPVDASVVAHEILHLFGALDLYFALLPDDERNELAKLYFPNDIMISARRELDSFAIGDLTAYLIGWRDSIDIRLVYFLLGYRDHASEVRG